MTTLNVSATARGLNYLPEYFAAATGLFEAGGITVVNTPKDPWTGVVDDLASGAADLALGGLWVPAMLGGMSRDLVIVGQLNARFPMAIVTREAVPDFDLAWLTGRTVLVPGVGGTAPYEFTAGLIREAGHEPGDTKFVRDLSTDLCRELFEGGTGDAMVADLTTATTLVHQGFGHIAYEHAEAGGVMPNSIYYARRDRLDEIREPVVAFVRAIGIAMKQLRAGTAEDVASLITGLWPDVPPAILTEVAGKLIAGLTWEGIRIDKTGSDRWTGMLYERGLVAHSLPYETLVAVDIADAAE